MTKHFGVKTSSVKLGNHMSNNSNKIPMKGGDEYDGLSKGSRKFYIWSRGQLKKIKRGYNKRFRKEGKKLDE